MDKAYERDNAILSARIVLDKDYVVIDTETTGLQTPEVCQLALVPKDNKAFCSLVKPVAAIEASATAVHGITNEMVADSSPIDAYWYGVIGELRTSQVLIGYNVSYDIKALSRSLELKGLVFRPSQHVLFDVMLCYAAFRGEISPAHGTFRWHKLSDALSHVGIEMDGDFHNALTDAYATLNLLSYMSGHLTSWEHALNAADAALVGIDRDLYDQAVSKITYRRV